MKLIYETFQLNFFSNNSDVAATPPVLAMLLNNLAGLSLLPMFGQEVNAFTGEKRQLVMMTDTEQKFRIEFATNSIIFHALGGSGEDFMNKVESALKSLQGIFPEKKANRLAFVNSQFYTDSAENYQALYNDVFTYHQVEPIEWENRIVERFELDDLKERANVVSTIRLCAIQAPMVNNGAATDVINFEVDVNTLPENASFRFDLKNSVANLRELYELSNKKMGKFTRYINK